MPIQEEIVYEALRRVQDPELMVNVVDLGLIYGVEVEEIDGKSNLLVIMTMTTPACPYAPELLQDVKDALRALADAGSVEVQLTMSPPWTPDRMTEDARDQLGIF
jgi:metal-sulfur cluster biosynthetic enzyme